MVPFSPSRFSLPVSFLESFPELLFSALISIKLLFLSWSLTTVQTPKRVNPQALFLISYTDNEASQSRSVIFSSNDMWFRQNKVSLYISFFFWKSSYYRPFEIIYSIENCWKLIKLFSLVSNLKIFPFQKQYWRTNKIR